MGKRFQISTRTVLLASGWLLAGAIAAWCGVAVGVWQPTAMVLGFVVGFNCLWGAVDVLRGRRLVRIRSRSDDSCRRHDVWVLVVAKRAFAK
jgi:hypothetical protein